MTLLVSYFVWPSTCSRRTCNRRPHLARVETTVEDGAVETKLLALCKRCNARVLAQASAAAESEEGP